jgi:hypothetical protein
MFLLGGIHRIFDQKLHGRAATNQFTSAAVDNLNNVAADLTFVDL